MRTLSHRVVPDRRSSRTAPSQPARPTTRWGSDRDHAMIAAINVMAVDAVTKD